MADELAAGRVVAIVHGRDEWGPRALGARSILADPRRAEMKDHLNAKIKFREEFRPFAPVVKEEAYGDWFETLGMQASPFMLYTHQALRPEQTAAVTHVDGTSRVQTVSAEQNPYLYRILDAFERRTGVPVLINTSFNLRGEPIVSSPSDALKTFFASGIDCLALEDCLVDKEMPGVAEIAPEKSADRAPDHRMRSVQGAVLVRRIAGHGAEPGVRQSRRFGRLRKQRGRAEGRPARSRPQTGGGVGRFGGVRGRPRLGPSARRAGARLAVPQRRPRRRPLHEHSAPRRRIQPSHRVGLNLLMLGWHPFVPPRDAPKAAAGCSPQRCGTRPAAAFRQREHPGRADAVPAKRAEHGRADDADAAQPRASSTRICRRIWSKAITSMASASSASCPTSGRATLGFRAHRGAQCDNPRGLRQAWRPVDRPGRRARTPITCRFPRKFSRRRAHPPPRFPRVAQIIHNDINDLVI